MAESKTVSTVTVIPLNGTNYPSWKVQCRMVLVREGLWGIVAGTEEPPDPATDAAKYAKYMRPGHDRVGGRPFTTLSPRRSGGSSSSLEEAVWTVPEKDLGQQTES